MPSVILLEQTKITAMAKAKKDIYEAINERVIAGLQKKGLNWFRPWNAGSGSGSFAPINNATGRAFNGLNVFILSQECAEMGYPHNEWITFKQAITKGGSVRKGQKSTPVIYWNIFFVDADGKFYKTAKQVADAGLTMSDVDKRFSPRLHNLFNIAQCDDIEPRRELVEPDGTFDPIERAEKVYEEFQGRPSLQHGGDRAYYSATRHHVQMPLAETFKAPQYYYNTLFHELVHSTGHKSMLKRFEGKVAAFGSKDYSKEELVAEIGSQYLAAIVGINVDVDNSQAYINGWISKLQSNPKMLVGAASLATKAVQRIIGEGQ